MAYSPAPMPRPSISSAKPMGWSTTRFSRSRTPPRKSPLARPLTSRTATFTSTPVATAPSSRARLRSTRAVPLSTTAPPRWPLRVARLPSRIAASCSWRPARRACLRTSTLPRVAPPSSWLGITGVPVGSPTRSTMELSWAIWLRPPISGAAPPMTGYRSLSAAPAC